MRSSKGKRGGSERNIFSLIGGTSKSVLLSRRIHVWMVKNPATAAGGGGQTSKA